MTEPEKIAFYFQEGSKIWSEQASRVIQKNFFELWETIQQPRPFRISSEQKNLQISGQTIPLPRYEGEVIGYYCWDDHHNCAALILETATWHQRWLLRFSEGNPAIEVQNPIVIGEEAIGHGEKMDVIYDLIAWLKSSNPEIDLSDVSRKQLLPGLDALASEHPTAVSHIKKMTADSVKKLLRSALEELAADEISNQLELPLDGNYAANISSVPNQHPVISSNVDGKTRWAIAAELEFLVAAFSMLAETEQMQFLPLAGALIIADDGKNHLTIKITLQENYLISQGDILQAYAKDSKEPIGTFIVDIYDGNMIYGRLSGDFDDKLEQMLATSFLRLPPHTASFVAAELQQLLQAAIKGDSFKNSALGNILGFIPFSFNHGSVILNELDEIQQYAFSAALATDNPVVLIQGPPGTGKTFLLEKIAGELCRRGNRILIAAPSNAAIDNICRRLAGYPLLRFSKHEPSIAPEVAKNNWPGAPGNIERFIRQRHEEKCGGIYAGTHLGLLREEIINDDFKQNGPYDAVIFDEAGMANVAEFILCARFASRVIVLGDHRQLPPFPMPQSVLAGLSRQFHGVPSHYRHLADGSAMEWLVKYRHIPVIMLKYSYRCQNPRLLRFASTLFYDAGIRASQAAEYYQLNYSERRHRFPASSLTFYSTSSLPFERRKEELLLEGRKPGLINEVEAEVCAQIFYYAVTKYPLEEISIIVPYRRQMKLIRDKLAYNTANVSAKGTISEEAWKIFLASRVATVDSFQGGESDLVIISYVRSNEGGGIGFIGNHNRVNVAHTRCRRELHIVGDLACLKAQADSNIFSRMEKAFKRDGLIIDLTEPMLTKGIFPSTAKIALADAGLKIT